ncbi:hypothetical protein [Bacillus mycoides]|uniref:hypothetical protein n=1 Tax=Bacillus mycoides TaxID=1405 RepID=UPI00273BD8D6|nr:hypothetical protein [Bacillus mycoides]
MNLASDSIEDIRRKIQEAIDNNQGRVIITDLDLDYPNGTIQLLKTVNNGEPLVMEESNIDSATDNDKVKLNGRITFLNEERLEAHASFYIKNEQTEIMLEIKLPNDWIMKNSLPVLPSSRLNNNTDNRTRESYLYDIRLDDARFFLTSHDRRYQPLNIILKRGLSLYGKLKFNGITKWLENYIGSPTIFGLIDNGENDAKIELSAKLSTINMQSIPLLDSELVFLAKLRGISSDDLSTATISGNVKIDNEKVLLHGDLTEEGLNPLELKVEGLNDVNISDLKELAPVVGNNDLETILPQGLQDPYYLQIKRMEIHFNTHQNTIPYVGVLVSTQKYWYILDGDFEVRQIKFEFVVESPFSSERSVTGLIKGQTELDIRTVLQFESKIPYGTFIEGNMIGTASLRDIAEKFIGRRGHNVPDFICNKFYIQIDEKKREFNLRADTEEVWNIQFGITHVDVIGVRLDIGGPFDGDRVAIIGGVVDIENNLFDISQTVMGDGSFEAQSIGDGFSLRSFLEKLCGSNIYPAALPNLTLEDMVFTITSPRDGSQIKLVSKIKDFGEIKIIVRQYQNQWNFLAALTLADEWKLSNISADFKKLDFLKFTNAMLIISSFTDSDVIDPSGIKGVEKGITFRANLHMISGGLDIIDHLLEIKELPLDTLIPEDPSDTRLKAKFDKKFEILGITFDDFNLFIKPKPNLTVEVSLSANVKIFTDSLDFWGKFGITQGQIEMNVSLRGEWIEPFGIVGLEIKKVFLGMKTGPQNIIDVVGAIDFGEGLLIDVKGEFIGNTVPSALIGSFPGSVCLLQIIKSFTGYQIPTNYLDVCLSDLYVYVVGNPLGVTIEDIYYAPGFHVRGKIEQFGIEAQAEVAIDYSGILLKGEMSPIKIDNLLEITGASPTGGPIVILEAYKRRFLFQLNVHLVVLGLSQETEILINKDEFYFKLEGKIFNVFEAMIEAKASGELKNGDFFISAIMKQEMLDFMIEGTKKIFIDSIEDAADILSNAEKVQKEANDAVDWLNKEIDKVKREFDGYSTKMKNALQDAKDRFTFLDNAITPLENDLSSWEEKLVDAIGAVLGKLKKKINEAKRQLNEWRSELEKVIKDRDILQEIVDTLIPPPILETLQRQLVEQVPVLDEANKALKDTQELVGKLKKVGDFITNSGENLLLIIDSVSFKGKLNDVGHGDVDLSIVGQFMGGNFDLQINFDFNEPNAGVKTLYEVLLGKIF